MTQLGAPATESSPGDPGRQAVRGSRLARRRRALFWVAGGAALLAIGGLIGASFVKSPQQIAADTAAPPPTATTAKVVSQILTSSVQMRGVVYPGTQYDVYPSAPESDAVGSGTGSAAAQVLLQRLAELPLPVLVVLLRVVHELGALGILAASL